MDRGTQIRVVVFRDGASWVAQCLEYDIGAQAADLDDLSARLQLALTVEHRTSVELHGTPFAGIAAAPEYFHEMWEKRSRTFTSESSVRPNGANVMVDLALVA